MRRGWDGVTIRDLGSKNGTLVDGAAIDRAGVELRDGAQIEIGNVVLRFRDPAERHLRGEPPALAGAAGAAGAGGAAPAAASATRATAGAARAGAGSPRSAVGAKSAAAGAAAGTAVPPLWVAV